MSMMGNLNELLDYLAKIPEDGEQRIPPLSVLSKDLGISVSTLREQLEVAKQLGVVDVKPKTGIRKKPFDFSTVLINGLPYAIKSNAYSIPQFSDLRKHLESAYFLEAVQLLNNEDLVELRKLVNAAKKKIFGSPSQNPVNEHREFHLRIYQKLGNTYLDGLMEAFWELYHLAGLEIYPDLQYIERVWNYHDQIITQIEGKNFSRALSLLIEHMEMINQREKSLPKLSFE